MVACAQLSFFIPKYAFFGAPGHTSGAQPASHGDDETVETMSLRQVLSTCKSTSSGLLGLA